MDVVEVSVVEEVEPQQETSYSRYGMPMVGSSTHLKQAIHVEQSPTAVPKHMSVGSTGMVVGTVVGLGMLVGFGIVGMGKVVPPLQQEAS